MSKNAFTRTAVQLHCLVNPKWSIKRSVVQMKSMKLFICSQKSDAHAQLTQCCIYHNACVYIYIYIFFSCTRSIMTAFTYPEHAGLFWKHVSGIYLRFFFFPSHMKIATAYACAQHSSTAQLCCLS